MTSRETAARLLSTALLLSGCGGGSKVDPIDTEVTAKVLVSVFAGGPVVGALVEVVVLDPATGQQLTARGDQGVVGRGGPTDQDGRTEVVVVGVNQGLFAVRAHGGAYANPVGAHERVELPASVTLSSLVPRLQPQATLSVPVTLWSTLADHAAVAYSQARNPLWKETQKISSGMLVTDNLFARHVVNGDDWSIRTTAPLPLSNATGLDARAYASLVDIALNQLAAETPGLSAPLLVEGLAADLSDALFDGKDAAGNPVSAGGRPLEVETTRLLLARALDAYASSTENGGPVKRGELTAGGVYEAMAGDGSLLYPREVPPVGTGWLKTDPSRLDVTVNAGGPVRNARVEVFAIAPDSGTVDASVGAKGLVGEGQTNNDGVATITLAQSQGIAILQAVARGGTYSDPTDPSRTIALGIHSLSAYVVKAPGTQVQRAAVTLLTTLSDAAARAIAEGRNLAITDRKNLAKAIEYSDGAVAAHLCQCNLGAGDVRRSVGEPLSTAIKGGVAVMLGQYSLNALAVELCRQTKAQIGKDLTAPAVVSYLVADLEADGLFNGKSKTPGGLTTPGSPGYTFSTESTRGQQARALDRWVTGPDNKTGLTRTTLEGAGVYGAMALDRSLLYPAGEEPPPFSLTRTPPRIDSLKAENWTRANTATVVVESVTDESGTGVRGVFASVNGGAPIQATQKGSEWLLKELGLPFSRNEIEVWAEDQAGNSGQNLTEPYKRSIWVGVDSTPPVLSYPRVASYVSERGLSLASDAVPPAVVLPGEREIFATDRPIYKGAGRTSWGPTRPTADELVATNPNNVPFLVLKYDAGPNDAPLREVKCQVAAEGGPEAPWWVLEKTTTSDAGYVLPISKETLFPTTGMGGGTSLAFTVLCTATDVAGNEATLKTPASGRYTYEIGPAPLRIREDLSYPARQDPRGFYAHKMVDGTYRNSFVSPVRFSRYVLTNPLDEAIRVKVTGHPVVDLTETYVDQVKKTTSTASMRAGETYMRTYLWTHKRGTQLCRNGASVQTPLCNGHDDQISRGCCEPSSGYVTCTPSHYSSWYDLPLHPCVDTEYGAEHYTPTVYLDAPDRWVCIYHFLDKTLEPKSNRKSTQTLTAVLYRYEDEPARETGGHPNEIEIPAASNGKPGRASLYLEKQLERAELESMDFVAPGSSAYWDDPAVFTYPAGQFLSWKRDAWIRPEVDPTACVGPPPYQNSAGTYERHRHMRVVETSQAQWMGRLGIASTDTSSNAAPVPWSEVSFGPDYTNPSYCFWKF